MKKHILAGALALLSGSFAAAAGSQDSTREAAVSRIGTAYAGATTLNAESPMVDRMLSVAKSANPSVTAEEWNKLKPEVATALNEAAAVGRVMEHAVRTASSSLTDKELEHLAQLLDDPVYRKFVSAINAPAVQLQVIQSSGLNAMRMGEAVNRVLQSHGLNVPR